MNIKRLLLLSQLKDQDFAVSFKEQLDRYEEQWLSDLKSMGCTYIALFRLEPYLFVYLEHSSDTAAFAWPEPCIDYLEQWPGGLELSPVVRLMDVFHDGKPSDKDTWRTQRKVESVHASMQSLRPEMVSSYVYYHYLKQEEQPEGFNKTYIIGAYQNLLFSYHESPTIKSDESPSGSLDTRNTPNNWHEIMQPHFMLQSESDLPWQSMELWLQKSI